MPDAWQPIGERHTVRGEATSGGRTFAGVPWPRPERCLALKLTAVRRRMQPCNQHILKSRAWLLWQGLPKGIRNLFSCPVECSLRPEETMPRVLLLNELPGALPDRGVLVLQTRPGRRNPSDNFRGEFLSRLTTIYAARQADLMHEDYYDRPWQLRTQDNALLLRVGNALQKIRDAGRHGAVVVRIIIQGPDNGAWRHQEVEQHLVELLTGRGAAVSLIAPTSPTRAQAVLYRPTATSEPSIVLEWFDLLPYLADHTGAFED
jgi:hypothetical protein